MVPQPFIFPQTKDTTTTTAVESCGAGLGYYLDLVTSGRARFRHFFRGTHKFRDNFRSIFNYLFSIRELGLRIRVRIEGLG